MEPLVQGGQLVPQCSRDTQIKHPDVRRYGRARSSLSTVVLFSFSCVWLVLGIHPFYWLPLNIYVLGKPRLKECEQSAPVPKSKICSRLVDPQFR